MQRPLLGIENESWGCGGNFLPQEYAMEFRRFAAIWNGLVGCLKH